MLKISIIQIDNEGMDFSGTLSPEKLNLDINNQVDHDALFEQKIDYNLHLSLVSGGILVAGILSTYAKCNCGRCLEDFNLDLTNTEVCHYYENINVGELDIAPDLREDLMMKLPMKFTCDEDCPGIILDKVKSESELKAEEELDAKNNNWQGLEGLKL